MSAHERPGKSDEWYTPAFVFEAMGVRFDMDVSAPLVRCPSYDWSAERLYQNALTETWRGFVWMNPPFGKRNGLEPWLRKFFDHGDGVALTPDRTSAPWWQAAARRADSVLFVCPKIHFIPGPGVEASSPGQGTTLMAAGPRGSRVLRRAEKNGLGLVLERP